MQPRSYDSIDGDRGTIAAMSSKRSRTMPLNQVLQMFSPRDVGHQVSIAHAHVSSIFGIRSHYFVERMPPAAIGDDWAMFVLASLAS